MAGHGSRGSAGGWLPSCPVLSALISPGPAAAAPGRLRPHPPFIRSPAPGGSGTPLGPHSAAGGGLEGALGPAPGLARPLKAAASIPKDPRASPPQHGRAGQGATATGTPARGGTGAAGPWPPPSSSTFPAVPSPKFAQRCPSPVPGTPPLPRRALGPAQLLGGSGREREAWGDPTGRRQRVVRAAPQGSCGVAGRTPGPGWGSRDTKKTSHPKTRRRRGPQKCRRGDKTAPGLPRDAPAPSTEAQPLL